MSELATLKQRRGLVLLSCDLQRATIARRLGRIERNPVRVALGAAAQAVSTPLAWRLGVRLLRFTFKAYRNRSAERGPRRLIKRP
jgi:hypothetical protein